MESSPHLQGITRKVSPLPRDLGVPCTIVMPEGASLAKIAATQRYGARWSSRGRLTTMRMRTRCP